MQNSVKTGNGETAELKKGVLSNVNKDETSVLPKIRNISKGIWLICYEINFS